VDKRIHRGTNPTNSSNRNTRVEEEAEDENGSVVIDMQDGDLVIVLFQDHDEGVDELGNFRHHEEPAGLCIDFVLSWGGHIEGIGYVRFGKHIDDLSNKHVDGEESEEDVVIHREGLHFQAARIGGELANEGKDEEHDDVEGEPEQRFEGVFSKSPVLLFEADEA